MNFFSKLVVTTLIILALFYVKDTFFSGNFEFPSHKKEIVTENKKVEKDPQVSELPEEKNIEKQVISIYFTNPANGKLRLVSKETQEELQGAKKIEFAIKELLKGPDAKAKKEGFSSEIPKGTRLLGVKDQGSVIIVDLSDDFQYGGGTESQYVRVNQVIRTILAQKPSKPVYLYLNGKKAEVIGGEGVIINQPISENSLNG